MGKYKFKLDARVKGIVEWRLARYREDKRELEAAVERLMPSPTPTYSLVSGGSGSAGRRTEEQAFKILSSPYLMQMEHDCKAIDRAIPCWSPSSTGRTLCGHSATRGSPGPACR